MKNAMILIIASSERYENEQKKKINGKFHMNTSQSARDNVYEYENEKNYFNSS